MSIELITRRVTTGVEIRFDDTMIINQIISLYPENNPFLIMSGPVSLAVDGKQMHSRSLLIGEPSAEMLAALPSQSSMDPSKIAQIGSCSTSRAIIKLVLDALLEKLNWIQGEMGPIYLKSCTVTGKKVTVDCAYSVL